MRTFSVRAPQSADFLLQVAQSSQKVAGSSENVEFFPQSILVQPPLQLCVDSSHFMNSREIKVVQSQWWFCSELQQLSESRVNFSQVWKRNAPPSEEETQSIYRSIENLSFHYKMKHSTTLSCEFFNRVFPDKVDLSGIFSCQNEPELLFPVNLNFTLNDLILCRVLKVSFIFHGTQPDFLFHHWILGCHQSLDQHDLVSWPGHVTLSLD